MTSIFRNSLDCDDGHHTSSNLMPVEPANVAQNNSGGIKNYQDVHISHLSLDLLVV